MLQCNYCKDLDLAVFEFCTKVEACFRLNIILVIVVNCSWFRLSSSDHLWLIAWMYLWIYQALQQQVCWSKHVHTSCNSKHLCSRTGCMCVGSNNIILQLFNHLLHVNPSRQRSCTLMNDQFLSIKSLFKARDHKYCMYTRNSSPANYS